MSRFFKIALVLVVAFCALCYFYAPARLAAIVALGRIAHGTSEDVLLRAADVVLKEKKKLILVPRETPLSLVHVKNFELLMLAGATILPANPFFYTSPTSIEQVVDTVVARVLDHLEIQHRLGRRWKAEPE